MNRRRLLMIGGLALAVGLLVSYAVYNQLRNFAGSSSNAASVPVLVAANDIDVGAKLAAKDVRVVNLPPTAVPPGAFSSPAKVLNRGAVLPIGKGEFILNGKLAALNAGAGLPSLIPPGMRAVSVRVNEVVSVAGFVGPGTRVDILLTGTPNGSSEPQTTTVLQNVAVIAAGQRLERNAAGDAQNVPVITLLVSPDDAERLTLASSEGHIQLSLRNPLDTRQDEVPAANAKGLYKGGTPLAALPVRPHTVKLQKAQLPPASPSVLSIEVYQGDKKPDVVKFPEQGSEDPK